MCSTEKKQPSDLRVDQAGSSTPFAGVLQLLALTPWHCHHQYPAAFSLDTCISLTNTAETNPRWGAVTALVYPPSCLPFWSRFGATSGGKVEIWMCLLRECAYVPADTYLYEDGHSQQRFVLLFICSKLLQAGARGISTVFLRCVQVTKLCLAAAFSDKAGLWWLASITL